MVPDLRDWPTTVYSGISRPGWQCSLEDIFSIVAQLAVAGSLLAKKKVNESIGSLKTDNVTFMIILVFIVYIFAALTFFPALALGPVAEHLSLWQ